MSKVQHAIDMYLDAIERAYGPRYRQDVQISFAGGHYVRIRHPDIHEGQVVPVGHLDLMTRQLLAEEATRKAA